MRVTGVLMSLCALWMLFSVALWCIVAVHFLDSQSASMALYSLLTFSSTSSRRTEWEETAVSAVYYEEILSA